MIRAFSRARWLQVATARGIYSGTDPETGEPTVAAGYLVDEIGHLLITPPVLDANEVEITPAVFDTWHSVNLRLHGPVADADEDTLYPGEDEIIPKKFLRSKFARWVREQGNLVMVQGVRAYQFGAGNNRVQLLDPRDIATPYRIWVGGLET